MMFLLFRRFDWRWKGDRIPWLLLFCLLSTVAVILGAIVRLDLDLSDSRLLWGQMFFAGDRQYLTQVSSIATSGLCDAQQPGCAIVGYPFLGLILPAVMAGIFGTVWPLALVGLTILGYSYVLATFVRARVGCSSFPAVCITFGILGGTLNDWVTRATGLHLYEIGLRFPRPFLTDLYLLISIALIAGLMRQRSMNAAMAMLAGILFALALYTNFYVAIPIALSSLLVAGLLVDEINLKRLPIFIAGFIFSSLLFVMQQYFYSDDYRLLLGFEKATIAFSYSEFLKLLWLKLGISGIAALGLMIFLRKKIHFSLLIFAFAYVVSSINQYTFGAISGKAVQIYHFQEAELFFERVLASLVLVEFFRLLMLIAGRMTAAIKA